MAWKRLVMELGMGTDIRGSDYTKAAMRAVHNALRQNSLVVADAFGKSRDEMRVDIHIGVQDPEAVDIEVLAIGRGIKSGEEFPVLWTVKHPKAKIVGNTLGHDERAHDLPAYKKILKNSLEWIK